MRSGLPGPQPGTGAEMHGKVEDTTPPILHGEGRDLNPPGWDEFSRTPDELADMSVQDSEIITYIRNPAEWQQYEHKDRAREYLRETPGGRVLRDAKGQPFIHGDTLLAAMPRELFEAREKQRMKETADFDRSTENPEETVFDEVPRWDVPDSMIGAYSKKQHYQNISAGLIGGQYAGMPVDQVIKHIGRDRYEAEQARYRNGGRHRASPNTQDQHERIQAARQMVTSSNKSGGVVSIPPGVRPRNTQAAAAARRGQ